MASLFFCTPDPGPPPRHAVVRSFSGFPGGTHGLKYQFMPIYEFACPKCEVIFSFLSKRVAPDRSPACPRCGNKKMSKQLSRFAMPKPDRPTDEAVPDAPGPGGLPEPDFSDPRVAQAMARMERDLEHMDEHNPRHMAHMLRRMKEIMPAGSTPKDLEIAIKRLESGEDPEKIEEDMGDLLGGGENSGTGTHGFSRDEGLHDY